MVLIMLLILISTLNLIMIWIKILIGSFIGVLKDFFILTLVWNSILNVVGIWIGISIRLSMLILILILLMIPIEILPCKAI